MTLDAKHSSPSASTSLAPSSSSTSSSASGITITPSVSTSAGTAAAAASLTADDEDEADAEGDTHTLNMEDDPLYDATADDRDEEWVAKHNQRMFTANVHLLCLCLPACIGLSSAPPLIALALCYAMLCCAELCCAVLCGLQAQGARPKPVVPGATCHLKRTNRAKAMHPIRRRCRVRRALQCCAPTHSAMTCTPISTERCLSPAAVW
jgi:hypothetical protein